MATRPVRARPLSATWESAKRGGDVWARLAPPQDPMNLQIAAVSVFCGDGAVLGAGARGLPVDHEGGIPQEVPLLKAMITAKSMLNG